LKKPTKHDLCTVAFSNHIATPNPTVSTASDFHPYIRSLQIGKSWFPEQAGSGLDRYYYALAQHLESANVGVHGLVAGSNDLKNTSQQTISAYASDQAPLWRRLWSIRRATARLLDQSSFDIVAAHFALYTAPVLDLVQDLPLIIHFHGPWARESEVEGDGRLQSWLKFNVERMVYRRGTRFIVLSNAFREILNTEYDVPMERIDVIPGGVDLQRFDVNVTQDEARMRLGWPSDVPIVLTVRRLAERMGLDHLIDAFVQVHQHLPEARLYLAGHGPLANTLRVRAKAAGLDDAIHFLGFVPDEDLPYAYAGATLSVVPTKSLEGFGLITVESLASGTPVLVTPVGGLPEVVEGLSSSLVFPDETPTTMATQLVNALTGAIKLPSSATCRAYARRHHDWNAVGQRVRASYERALAD